MCAWCEVRNFASHKLRLTLAPWSSLILENYQRWAWTGSELDILQDTCNFFGSGLDLDIHFWKKLDQDRIRILVWFLQRNFPESDSIQHVTNDGGSVFLAMVFTLSVWVTLIAINSNSFYFIAEMSTDQDWIGLDQDWSQFWPDQDWIGLRIYLLF